MGAARTITIAVGGAHSTGKSSFLARLGERLQRKDYRVATVDDLASAAQRAGFPILREHTFDSTLWIMARGISLELEARLRADIVLVDRPLTDALAYLRAALECRGETLDQRHNFYLEELLRLHVPHYDIIFKAAVDPTVPIDASKWRDPDPAFRRVVARHIDEVFATFLAHWHPLRRKDSDAAVAYCLEKVRGVVPPK